VIVGSECCAYVDERRHVCGQPTAFVVFAEDGKTPIAVQCVRHRSARAVPLPRGAQLAPPSVYLFRRRKDR